MGGLESFSEEVPVVPELKDSVEKDEGAVETLKTINKVIPVLERLSSILSRRFEDHLDEFYVEDSSFSVKTSLGRLKEFEGATKIDELKLKDALIPLQRFLEGLGTVRPKGLRDEPDNLRALCTCINEIKESMSFLSESFKNSSDVNLQDLAPMTGRMSIQAEGAMTYIRKRHGSIQNYLGRRY